MIRLVKFTLFGIPHGQDLEKLNYRSPVPSRLVKYTNRQTSGMENIGSNPLGPPVAIRTVIDGQLLDTVMYTNPSFAVEDVTSFTLEDTPRKPGPLTTTRSALET